MTVSPPVRIAAACGLVFALVIGGGLMLLGRHSSSSTPPAPLVIRHHPAVTKPKPATKVTPARKAAHHAVVKAPVVHVHKAPVRPVRPAVDAAALAAGLPISLARALAQHEVVVVAVFDPQSEVDGIAYAEAQAGAQEAGVGFVGLDVLGGEASTLTQKLGQLLPDPGILVYKRPAVLAEQMSGFVDKDTVAQAAQNAAPVSAPIVTAPTWWARVNSACATLKVQAPVLIAPATRAQVRDWVTKEVAYEQQALAAITTIPLSAAGSDRASAEKFLALLRKDLVDEQKLAAVLANGGTLNASLVSEDQSLAKQAIDLATQHGAGACAGGA